MPKAAIRLNYKPHKHQRAFHKSKARFRTLIAGVRGGKTVAGAFELVKHALSIENGIVWAVAPTYKMVKVAEREIQLLLDQIPEFVIDRSIGDKSWTLISGTVIECKSTDYPDNLRGPGIDACWIDEAAYVKVEALRIIRTRTSDKLGKIWITTTPKGRNWCHKWFMKGKSVHHKNRHYDSFKWQSNENPYFPKSEWEDARQDLPADFFAQEYEAEFLDKAASVFRNVDNCILQSDEYASQGPYTLGIDWAKSHDWTVMIVMDAMGTVVEWKRIQQEPWPFLIAEARDLQKKWNAKIVHDSTGIGSPIHDELVEEVGEDNVVGIPFSTKSKENMVQSLQHSFENSKIQIPDIELFTDEIRWYEMKRLSSGKIRYSAPDGMHDDCVSALMLANWYCRYEVHGMEPEVIKTEPLHDIANRRNSGLLVFGSTPSRMDRDLWSKRGRRGYFGIH